LSVAGTVFLRVFLWKFQSMNPSPLQAAARRLVVSWSYTTQVRARDAPRPRVEPDGEPLGGEIRAVVADLVGGREARAVVPLDLKQA
jgi:hypothetical protein